MASTAAAATPYHDVTVIDPGTGTAHRIPINGKVTAFTQSPDGAHIYAAYDGYGDRPDAAGVHIIDTGTNATHNISLPGWGPNLTISPNSANLYASTYINGGYQLSAVNTPTDTTFALGRIGNPSSLVVSPDGARAYFITDTDDGGGRYLNNVAALDTATSSTELVNVGRATRLIVSPDSSYVLAPSTTFEPATRTYHHELSVIDTATGTLRTKPIVMPGPVIDIEFSPDSSTIYVTNYALESGSCGFSLTAVTTQPAAPVRSIFPLSTVAV